MFQTFILWDDKGISGTKCIYLQIYYCALIVIFLINWLVLFWLYILISWERYLLFVKQKEK